MPMPRAADTARNTTHNYAESSKAALYDAVTDLLRGPVAELLCAAVRAVAGFPPRPAGRYNRGAAKTGTEERA
jgi:hypothetical protein